MVIENIIFEIPKPPSSEEQRQLIKLKIQNAMIYALFVYKVKRKKRTEKIQKKWK
jgi:hypothetical protein